MTDLTRRTLLDPLTLDGRDYFASLLAERADAWSHGLSTPLPAERAQQLLGSVLYIGSPEF